MGRAGTVTTRVGGMTVPLTVGPIGRGGTGVGRGGAGRGSGRGGGGRSTTASAIFRGPGGGGGGVTRGIATVASRSSWSICPTYRAPRSSFH